MQANEQQLTPARAALLDAERYRADPALRVTQWSAALWAKRLDTCVAEDQRRDREWGDAILRRTRADPQLPALALQFRRVLDADAQWYHWLFGELDTLRQKWKHSPPRDAILLAELAAHQRALAEWVREREQRVTQMTKLLQALPKPSSPRAKAQKGKRWWAMLQPLVTRLCPHPLRAVRPIWVTGEPLPSWLLALAITGLLVWLSSPSTRRGPVIFSPPPTAIAQSIPTAAPLMGTLKPQTGRGPEESAVAPRPTAVLGTSAAADSERAAALNQAALDLMRSGDCIGAQALNEQAIEADPRFYKAPNDLAFCLYALGHTERAIDQWQIALMLKPDNADAHAALGVALHTSGKLGEGRRRYQRALELDVRYQDPAWLRRDAVWSADIIADSEALRAALSR